MVKFGNEHLKLARWTCGVYKVIINDKWFYIGSSVDLKRRLSTWKCYWSGKKKYIKNRSILYVLPLAEKVNFEILELITNGSNPKEREDVWVKENFDNELCLNLTPDTINGKGRKLPLGVVRREKKQKGVTTASKPVAQFYLNNKYIRSFASIGEAARFLKCKTDPIRWVTQGYRSRYKQYLFKLISKDGSFIEPLPFVRKKSPYVYIPNKKTTKVFYQTDFNGNIIDTFHNAQTAATKMGVSRTSIHKVLKGIGRIKRVKGFYFRYA